MTWNVKYLCKLTPKLKIKWIEITNKNKKIEVKKQIETVFKFKTL